jgi:hypothetical protein
MIKLTSNNLAKGQSFATIVIRRVISSTVEQLTLNQLVPSSNLGLPIFKSQAPQQFEGLGFWLVLAQNQRNLSGFKRYCAGTGTGLPIWLPVPPS